MSRRKPKPRGTCPGCRTVKRIVCRGLCSNCYKCRPDVRAMHPTARSESPPAAWSRADDAAVRRMVTEGKRTGEIATALGRTESAVLNRRHKIGAVRYRKRAAERRRTVAALVSADPGATCAEIAKRIGCSRETVMRHRRAQGLPTLTRAEWTRAGGLTSSARRAGRSVADLLTRGQRAVLAALDGGPLSPQQVAQRIGKTRVAASQLLYALRKKGLAFAEGRRGRARADQGGSGTKWHALNWWLTANAGMVYHVAHKVRAKNPHADVEDLASEVRLSVARCVRSFKACGVKFSTYALRAAYFDAVGFAMDERRGGIRVPQQLRFDGAIAAGVGSLDAIADAQEGAEAPIRELAARADGDAPPMDPAFWERATKGLTARQRQVVLAHFRDGRLYVDIGRELGVSRERVRQVAEQALELIRRGKSLAEYEVA